MRRKITARKITEVTVVAVAAVGAAGLARPVASQASDSSATLRYHCGFPVIGVQSVVAEVAWTIPPTVQVGQPMASSVLSVRATIPPQVVLTLRLRGAASLSGTADIDSAINAPQGVVADKATLTVPKVSVPALGSMTVSASGKTPPVSLSQAGSAHFDAGAIAMHLRGYTVGGSPEAPFDVDCTLDRGQSDVVATFEIAAAAPTSSATSSSVAQTPTSSISSTAQQPAASSASSSGGAAVVSSSAAATVPTRRESVPSASSVEAIAPLTTSDSAATGSAVPTDSVPAAAEHATSGTDAAASPTADKGAAVTDWLIVACALLAAGGAGVFTTSRLKKRQNIT
ncbi:hypothetical protein Caci_5864 [Catenulispora acidiphila DSM 44928]|uniref:DUF6801 domain-containing protein n=1 Tax=Catenulispora acidiphila (strain DSM 44928 / JCM 14897 / NBRC 102108 / NRRL B-24433 / ID139908) TaxID=479433 RepID=C7QDU8_CATAD|nr:hypothetical protein Caci_5864 [Catenulispora acidiphila DSM 44928]